MRFLKRAAQWLLGVFGYHIVKRAPDSGEIAGYFVDSAGNRHTRFTRYQTRVWPMNWQQMHQERTRPAQNTLFSMVQTGRNAVAHMQQKLSIHGLTTVGKEVLEIGAFAGAAAYALADLGASRVVGIDVSESHAIFDGPVTPEAIRVKSEWLQMLRQDVQGCFLANGATFQSRQVRFLDLDIRQLSENQNYDLIVSWQTLEHVFEPAKAFERIYSALKPGGISYHDYHPFFCESGAHFDTLDFPWGHVRLSPQDFDRYLQLYRPDELEVSRLRFYSTINRMTLSDLKHIVASAGFKTVEWVEMWDDLNSVNPQILQECRKNYPSLTLEDLATYRVILILQKPF